MIKNTHLYPLERNFIIASELSGFALYVSRRIGHSPICQLNGVAIEADCVFADKQCSEIRLFAIEGGQRQYVRTVKTRMVMSQENLDTGNIGMFEQALIESVKAHQEELDATKPQS